MSSRDRGGPRRPRRLIVADRDGIVAIPAASAESVVAEAEEKAHTESDIRVAVRDGMSPLEAYERSERLEPCSVEPVVAALRRCIVGPR